MTILVAFDFEGTLVKEEFLVELAKRIGKGEEANRITKLGLTGMINWDEGLERRVEMLKGMDYDTVMKTAEKYTPLSGVKETIDMFKKNGCEIVVITGGFDVLAKKFCDDFGIKHLVCNKFIYEKGKISGADIEVNSNKAKWLTFFSEKFGAELTVAFGDGANDIPMVKAATFGKIISSKENIFEASKKILEQIEELNS